MQKIKRVLKIGGITIGGIFALLVVVGLIIGPQQKAATSNQPSAATSSDIQNVVASDAATTTPTDQPQVDVPPATASAVVPSSAPASANPTPTAPSNQTNLVKVVSVVDGDTIKVSLNGETQTVRLIGIDTPETVDPRKPVQCFGKEASAKAKTVLTGQMVRLESDPTQGDLDKYQRLLRYVFLSDGTFFNEMMVAEGYAHEYTYDTPYQYQAEFKAAQAAAEKAQLGLWSPATCNGDTTQPAASSTPRASQAQPVPSSQSSGHIFYLSTYYTAKYYYCDTDPGWQSLSKDYLKSYPSEQALLAAYPSRTLHAACE